METKKILGIIFSLVFVCAFAFVLTWAIINFNKVKEGMSGTQIYTNEDLDKAYNDGIIDKVLITNLIYQTPELLSRDWYINCDMSKYIAYIIDTLNHDTSISDLLNPNEKIQTLVAKYKAGEI